LLHYLLKHLGRIVLPPLARIVVPLLGHIADLDHIGDPGGDQIAKFLPLSDQGDLVGSQPFTLSLWVMQEKYNIGELVEVLYAADNCTLQDETPRIWAESISLLNGLRQRCGG
jgi:hypothetical protein